MILHMASFRFREGTTDDEVAELTTALAEMAAQIDVLRSYVAAANLHVRPGGADFGVVALVDDAVALETYLDHPLHKAVYDRFLGTMVAERTAAQLPLESGSLV